MTLAATFERSKQDRESWKYTSLAPLAAEKFIRSAALAEAPQMPLPSIVADARARHQIVFYNGVWQSKLSRLGELEGLMREESGGYRLALAGKTCLVTAPVELVFVADGSDEPREIGTKLTIELGESGRLTLIEHHIAPAGQQPIAGIYETDIRLGPQAKLVHGKIVDVGARMSALASTRVIIAEGAYYDNFVLIKSGRIVRNEIEARLTGKLAQCALNGVMLLRGSSHADTTTHIIHQAPFGSSREVYKSVVAEKARAVFQGNVTVAEGAQKTDARQLSRSLLLSDQAEADMKPELKIYADDVKCSHGATVGALDDDALFYLRARGLSEQAARAMLIRAFAGEILDTIQMPEWRDYCRAQTEEWCDEQE